MNERETSVPNPPDITDLPVPDRLRADLVLDGGGVKGIGLVGAAERLSALGYTFPRVAGSSAGAIVGAMLTALELAGEPVSRMVDMVRTLDYTKFRDLKPLPKMLRPFGSLSDWVALFSIDGIYEGEYLRQWLSGALADLGVRTFGDLRLPAGPGSPHADLPPDHRYRLVVTAADISRRRLTLFPWDYRDVYGLDPDEQPVADAARASASIPFYFRPFTLTARADRGVSTLVDGAILSSYPITLFDRADGVAPRWPTFGVRLLGPQGPDYVAKQVTGPLPIALATMDTLIDGHDRIHLEKPCTRARTAYVDTGGISPYDFDISRAQQEELLAAGGRAVDEFLARWDFQRYLAQCRGGAS